LFQINKITRHASGTVIGWRSPVDPQASAAQTRDTRLQAPLDLPTSA
jgi:hypothetical protein